MEARASTFLKGACHYGTRVQSLGVFLLVFVVPSLAFNATGGSHHTAQGIGWCLLYIREDVKGLHADGRASFWSAAPAMHRSYGRQLQLVALVEWNRVWYRMDAVLGILLKYSIRSASYQSLWTTAYVHFHPSASRRLCNSKYSPNLPSHTTPTFLPIRHPHFVHKLVTYLQRCFQARPHICSSQVASAPWRPARARQLESPDAADTSDGGTAYEGLRRFRWHSDFAPVLNWLLLSVAKERVGVARDSGQDCSRASRGGG